MSLDDVVAQLADGMTIGIGGWATRRKPMALIRAIANDVAPDVRTLRPDLPQTLADVVALALEKHPDVRYADGDAMAADLRAVAAALPADTPAPGAGEPGAAGHTR